MHQSSGITQRNTGEPAEPPLSSTSPRIRSMRMAGSHRQDLQTVGRQ